jgi:phosphoglycolate phosphatase-like HAD superfamily hydrolase
VDQGTFTHYFFDWDGCLANTLPIWHEIYRALLRRRGIDAGDQAIVRELFNDWAGPARFGIREVDQFAREVQEGLGERVDEMGLNAHAAETLRELHRRGARCAVLTATRRHLVVPVLAREGITHTIDLLLTLDEVPACKPDPVIVFRALELLDAAPERAILVGDSSKDLQTAVNAGVASVLYFPPGNARYYELDELRRFRPGYVIRDFRELLTLAPEHGAGNSEGARSIPRFRRRGEGDEAGTDGHTGASPGTVP